MDPILVWQPPGRDAVAVIESTPEPIDEPTLLTRVAPVVDQPADDLAAFVDASHTLAAIVGADNVLLLIVTVPSGITR